MNRIFQMAFEVLIFASIYLLASAITWRLRIRRRDEDAMTMGIAGCLRCLLAHVSRSMIVIVLTFTGIALCVRLHLEGVFLPQAAHIDAWVMFWEFVLLIAFVEWSAVIVCRVFNKPFPVPDLLLNIVRGLLVGAALLAVLRFQLNINVSPVIGASALLTAVIGFALQGVLGNLLAGMSLHIVRSVVPGDWVAIGDLEGEVIQTNWRETRLRTIAGHILVVPNSTVSTAIVHNMSRPTPLRRHKILVGASCSDAPGDVIAAMVESAKAVPDVLRDPAPSAYLVEYKDVGINYALRFWTNRYFDRTAVEGDVMRLIWYQFKRCGIEIPCRRQLPEERETKRNVDELMRSDFFSKLLVDEKGAPLLRAEQLTGIAASLERLRFTQGETVFRQGEEGDNCYVVAMGKARGRVEYKDATQAIEFDLGSGALFGEMSLLTGLPRTATVFVNEEVELLKISKETFKLLLGMREDIPQILAKLVAERAGHNSAMFDKLQAMGAVDLDESIKSTNILKRFLRMLGRGQ